MNDLDLTVVNKNTGKVYYPNGMNAKDSTNNAERVIVPDPSDGDEFVVNVRGANMDRAEQFFSLVITGCITFEGSEADIGDRKPGAANAVGGRLAAMVALATSVFFFVCHL